ncbi:sensor histidine kinase [Mucilaginibacter sp. 22184]|uniref:sensor histidine kinase n=1 Tax=Mucilaginibacter sp. 22184 TaxID=3453887 RepID=UPI003F846CDA
MYQIYNIFEDRAEVANKEYVILTMRKRFQFIFLIAVLTATGILFFQLYWVYSVYKTGKENFSKTLTAVLEKSIVSYELQQNQLPASLKYKTPSLSVFMDTTVENQVPDSVKSMLKNAKTIFTVRYKSMAINSNDLPMVKLMLARLIAQQLSKPVKMDVLAAIYKGELAKEKVRLPFRLVLFKNQKSVAAGHIGVPVGFLQSPAVIEAEFGDLLMLSLKQNMFPVLVSFLLICLSAGCLFYMGRVIKTQIQLDDIKNDFINNMTHELRTPISILNTSNEALLYFGAAEDPAKIRRYLHINTAVLEKLSANVERILDITRYEQGLKLAKREPVGLRALLENTLHLFAGSAETVISLFYHLPQEEIVTDGYMISTIVSNLIDNAIKYSHAKVKVEVIVNGLSASWQLIVKDNGSGMASSVLPFIYDKFFRIQEGDVHEVKGYGLGLSYVKQLVTTLGGVIRVESEQGKGTSFIINFPY